VVVDEGWSYLPEHWCCAFRQAWAAYVAGTIPVGAVVVDPHGVVAAEARNRIFDTGAPTGQLAGSWLAHAELNAIAQIDAKRSTTSEGWAVYSTVRAVSAVRRGHHPWPSPGASRWDMPVRTRSARNDATNCLPRRPGEWRAPS